MTYMFILKCALKLVPKKYPMNTADFTAQEYSIILPGISDGNCNREGKIRLVQNLSICH